MTGSVNTKKLKVRWIALADAKEKQAADEAAAKFKHKEVKSATKPIVAADGHVVLSQEDIDARDQ